MSECEHDKQLIVELKAVIAALLDVYEGEWSGFSTSAAGMRQRRQAIDAEHRAWRLLEEADDE